MCLEFKFAVATVLMVAWADCQTQSPCPNTFQYQRDLQGELYGTIGVYSLNENVILLNVEMSVGNPVNNNENGKIELLTPRQEVYNTIQRRRPVKYNVYFPYWENVPPRVTKIMVNGQVVCSGPPLRLDGYFNYITTVSLQHRFMINVGPLRARNPFVPDNSVTDNYNNNNFFVPQKPRKEVNPFIPFLQNGGSGNVNDGEVDLNVYDVILTTTTRPTTPKSVEGPTPNDLLYPENPFFHPRDSDPTPPRPKPTIKPTRKRPTPTPTGPRFNSDASSISDICGMPLVPNPLIVKGQVVPKGAFPWLVAIFVYTDIGVEYQCSGTLVSNRHIVTAAHCLEKKGSKIPPERFLFILGKLNIASLVPSKGETLAEAERIEIHPDYVPLKSDADIGVVVLKQEVEFTSYIRPICVWFESDDLDLIVGQSGKVVGWGRDGTNNTMNGEPKQITVPIVSQEQCLRSSEAFKEITSTRTFCAGERNDRGPCNGDSGSGFIMKRNNRWCLKGIVSISVYDSVKSCDLSHYVVYTDVSKFRSWLSSIVGVQ